MEERERERYIQQALKDKIREFIERGFSPLEEVNKTSSVVLGLSTGVSALLVGVAKDTTTWGIVRLGSALSIMIFVSSVVQWLAVATSMVGFRQVVSKALLQDPVRF